MNLSEYWRTRRKHYVVLIAQMLLAFAFSIFSLKPSPLDFPAEIATEFRLSNAILALHPSFSFLPYLIAALFTALPFFAYWNWRFLPKLAEPANPIRTGVLLLSWLGLLLFLLLLTVGFVNATGDIPKSSLKLQALLYPFIGSRIGIAILFGTMFYLASWLLAILAMFTRFLLNRPSNH